MEQNEERMKTRGENRVWNTIIGRSGNVKKIPATQLGQQIIFDDALTILPAIREWIEKGSASIYRKELKDYFVNDDILIQKITETFLLLAGSAHITLFRSDTKKVATRHKRINLIQKKLMPELSFDQVWRFTETVIEASEYFEVDRTLKFLDNKAKWNMSYVCNLGEVITSKLAIDAHTAFFPEPMLTPPIDWSFEDNILTGGYETYQYELVRADSFKVDYSRYPKKIFDSVNYIQSTPWKINRPIIETLKKDLLTPKKEQFIKSPYPNDEGCEWDIDLKKEDKGISSEKKKRIVKIRAAFGEKVELYSAEAGDFESAMGKYRAVKLAIGIADQYSDDDVLYFPHSYDFRGRIYPLPVGLSPQGSDAVKAMLTYKNGEVLTERGAEWCWAFLASLYGDDKLDFVDRVKRGKELLHEDYKEADEPYQFLAHQLEMREWVEDMEKPVTIRIHMDACNSGSQFTSAITGDRDGCIATNVIPTMREDGGQDRQDAYLLVSDKCLGSTIDAISEVPKDAENKPKLNNLRYFKKILEDAGRKICKKPVMVSNYGGTAGGRAEIVWDMLRELGAPRFYLTKKNASMYAKIIGDAIVGVLNGGKAFEQYIQLLSNIIAKKNRPVTWTTSDGFYVVHQKYKELKSKQVSCILPGARRATTINKKVFSDKLSAAKMRSAISPNYIHSLDAELLRRTALKMGDNGVADTDWIHDSFGCHPNYVDLLLEVTKNEFKKLVRRLPLKELDRQLREQADKSKATQKALALVKIPQLKGFDASNGGLDIVETSDWFFS